MEASCSIACSSTTARKFNVQQSTSNILALSVQALIALALAAAMAGLMLIAATPAFADGVVATVLDSNGKVVSEITTKSSENDRTALERGWNNIKNDQTYRLETDWHPTSKGILGNGEGFHDGSIKFARTGTTLDLNGHTIEGASTRRPGSEAGNHRVILIPKHSKGTTTICDSSDGRGTLYGGNWDFVTYGSSIRIEGGNVNISGINITGTYVGGATSSAGGVYIAGGKVNMSDIHFEDNGGGGSAGDIYVEGGTNTFTDITSKGAEVVMAEGASMLIKGGTNTFTNVTIEDASIWHQEAISKHHHGGAMYINGGTNTFNDLTIKDSYTEIGHGGGLYIDNGKNTFNNLTVEDCAAVIDRSSSGCGKGGGIYVNKAGTTFNGLTLIGNRSYDNGGGMYIAVEDTTLKNVTIKNNSALSGDGKSGKGGGIYFDCRTAKIDGGVISGNTAVEDGGGLYLYSLTTSFEYTDQIKNVTFENNSAKGNGGAIYTTHRHNRDSKNIYYQNVVFNNNKAGKNGGGVYDAGHGATFDGLTASGNSAKCGSVIYVDGAETTINNLYAIGNTVSEGGNIFVNAVDFVLGGDSAVVTHNKCTKSVSDRSSKDWYGCAGIYVDSYDDLLLELPVLQVHSNVDANGNPSNLWLENGLVTTAYVGFGQDLQDGSKVGVRLTNSMKEKDLSKNNSSRDWDKNASYFSCDEEGWVVKKVSKTNIAYRKSSGADPTSYVPLAPTGTVGDVVFNKRVPTVDVSVGNPNDEFGVETSLEYSLDGGNTWQAVSKDNVVTLSNDGDGVATYAVLLRAVAGEETSESTRVIVNLPARKLVAQMPEAVEDLSYTASVQTGITGGSAWDYVSGDISAIDAGTYTVVVKPIEGYLWEDTLTDEERSIDWYIQAATLTATYPGETINADLQEQPELEVVVTGFMGDDSADSIAGYEAPTVSVDGIDLTVASSHKLTPAGGVAENYGFEYVAGTLDIVTGNVADNPRAAVGLTYTGADQVGVLPGDHYQVAATQGDGCVASATDAGTYRTSVELEDGYIWPDGTTAPKTVEWTIDRATLTATYVGETIACGGDPAYDVEVTGFVGSEDAQSAEGYVAPSVDGAGADLRTAGTYALAPAGGKAANYTFRYVEGSLVVDLPIIPVPSVEGDTDASASGTLQGTAIRSLDDEVRLIVNISNDSDKATMAERVGSELAGCWDVRLYVNGQQVHDDFGSFDLSLPSLTEYANATVTVWHLHNDDSLTSKDVQADAAGSATVTVSDLSTFAIPASPDDPDDPVDPDPVDPDPVDPDDPSDPTDPDNPSDPADTDDSSDSTDSDQSGDSNDSDSSGDEGNAGKSEKGPLVRTGDSALAGQAAVIVFLIAVATAIAAHRRRHA